MLDIFNNNNKKKTNFNFKINKLQDKQEARSEIIVTIPASSFQLFWLFSVGFQVGC